MLRIAWAGAFLRTVFSSMPRKCSLNLGRPSLNLAKVNCPNMRNLGRDFLKNIGGGGEVSRLEWNYTVNFCLVYLKIKLTDIPCFLIANVCTITVKHPLEADYCITMLMYFDNIWKSVSLALFWFRWWFPWIYLPPDRHITLEALYK